ncbi:MAG TPA: RNB domain-containing ribonuclease [Opitutaceae bacterium]|nr:RNB domain-containing ribonuclease [Opitutaceae bacterium]
MTEANGATPSARLRRIARRVMQERGLEPDFPAGALAELARIKAPAPAGNGGLRDLRALPWCSIDNDESRDLDQLTVAEALPQAAGRLLVAVADVDALVKRGSALDAHARKNTTSVYTAAEIFPMLPEPLSTDLTSLSFGEDRAAIVVDMTIGADGSLLQADVFRAVVRNKAKLAYDSVAAWLEGSGPVPPAIGAVPDLAENIQLQAGLAGRLRDRRHQQGALVLETNQARPVFEAGELKDLAAETRNRARDLIEDCMIAANGVVARFLAARNFPVMRRIVRTPRRWDRLVALAGTYHFALPEEPEAKALQGFLDAARQKDPKGFAALSLVVIKLMGRGEYVVELPGGKAQGHFGLAVRDYAHSTAPNRRFPDLITQRLIKAALAGTAPPYPSDELAALAAHCTQEEDAAKKVERQVAKSAAAILLSPRLGQIFDVVVTAITDHDTWISVAHPNVEGKLVENCESCRVGDRFRAKLVHVDVERGFIDFAKL